MKKMSIVLKEKVEKYNANTEGDTFKEGEEII